MGEVFITRRSGQSIFLGRGLPEYSYSDATGHSLINDGIEGNVQNWRIKFYNSGIFIPKENMTVDVFLVGGGGGGNASSYSRGGGGGGGGYTACHRNISLTKDTSYQIIIGAGGEGGGGNGTSGGTGGTTSAFSQTAAGGYGGTNYSGGNGGSGGGQGGYGDSNVGAGGTNGDNGGIGASSDGELYGLGQEGDTREFNIFVVETYIVGANAGQSDWLSLTENGSALSPSQGIIYSIMTEGNYYYQNYKWNGEEYLYTDQALVYSGGGGGGGGSGSLLGGAGGAGGGGNGGSGTKDTTVYPEDGGNGLPNTGGGGGGEGYHTGSTSGGGTGGSGIVVIRNSRG